MTPRRRPAAGPLAAAFLALLAALAHLPCLTGGWVWDDVEIVKHRPAARSIGEAARGLAKFRPWRAHRVAAPRPRPLRDLLLALDFTIWRGRAFGAHAGNWALHAAVAALAWAALRSLGASAAVAFAAAALFALHPAGAETVAQLKNRGDLAAAAACLLSLLAARRLRPAWAAGAASLAAYLAGLLCAQWPIAAPVAFAAAWWMLGRPRRGLAFAPHAALAAAFAWGAAGAGRGGPDAAAAAARFAAYVGLTAWPASASPAPETSFALAAAAGAAAVWLAWTRRVAGPARGRPIAAGAAWAAAMIAPLCFISARVSGRTLAMHRLYFASLGAAWALSAAAAARPAERRRRLALTAAAAAAFAALTAQEHFIWASPVRLWSEYVRRLPDAPEGCLETARRYVNARRFAAAEFSLRSAAQRAAADPAAWRSLGPEILGAMGYLELQRGRLKAALAWLERSRSVRETSVADNTLGMALERLGDHVKAMQAFARALSLDPRNALAHHNLGNALSRRGEWDAAGRHYAAAVRIDPDLTLSWLAWGRVLYRQGRLAEAKRRFEAAARGETYAEAQRLLGLVALDERRLLDAWRHARAALAADAASWRAWLLAGYVAEAAGRAEDARAAYRRVLKLKPGQPEAKRRAEALARKAAAPAKPKRSKP